MLIAASVISEHLVIGRHVHDEDVADAPSPVRRPVSSRDDRAQELVGVQAALHRAAPPRPCRTSATAFGRRWRGCAARRRCARLSEIDPVRRRPSRGSSPPGPTRIGSDQPVRPASIAPASARRLAGMRHRGRRPGRGCGIAPATVRTCRFRFVCVMTCPCRHRNRRRGRRPGFLQERSVRTIASATPHSRSGCERRLVMLDAHRRRRR